MSRTIANCLKAAVILAMTCCSNGYSISRLEHFLCGIVSGSDVFSALKNGKEYVFNLCFELVPNT